MLRAVEGKGCPATQEHAAGFCRKAEAAGEPDNSPRPCAACVSTEHRRDLQGSHPTAPSSQLTAHSTKAQEAQITLTSKEAGLAYTGKQQRFQTERLDSHIPSQLKGAPPGVPPAPVVRCVR